MNMAVQDKRRRCYKGLGIEWVFHLPGLVLEPYQVCVCKDEVYVSLSEHATLQLDVPMMKDCLARRIEYPRTRRVYRRGRGGGASETVVVIVDRV